MTQIYRLHDSRGDSRDYGCMADVAAAAGGICYHWEQLDTERVEHWGTEPWAPRSQYEAVRCALGPDWETTNEITERAGVPRSTRAYEFLKRMTREGYAEHKEEWLDVGSGTRRHAMWRRAP